MKFTNILAAGAMAATALVTPMATAAQSAGAGAAAQVSTTQTVSDVHPCKYHKRPKKCRARGHGGGYGREDKIKIDIRIDNQKPDKEGQKPGETKPGETKPGETKPGETKPGETKPGETKPGETKPGETKPGETKPGEAGPNKGGGIDIR
jgi:hypothetical protein